MNECPRCGQTVIGPARVCDACRDRDRDRADGEALRRFAPAPAPMPGSLVLEGVMVDGDD